MCVINKGMEWQYSFSQFASSAQQHVGEEQRCIKTEVSLKLYKQKKIYDLKSCIPCLWHQAESNPAAVGISSLTEGCLHKLCIKKLF